MAATKAKSRPTSKKPAAPILSPLELPLAPPVTTEEYIQHIHILGQRVVEHVGFMRRVEKLGGTSAEARYRSLTQFYDRLSFMEQELLRIKEELELG